MRYSFKVTVSVPDNELEDDVPTKGEVAQFLREEVLTAGGCTFPGDDETAPDWRFVLARAGSVTVTGIPDTKEAS